jgi:hypothetical protein
MDLAEFGGMASKSPEVLRLAGQSIRDRKEQLTDNWLIPIYSTFVFTWLLWGWEEYKARTHQPPQPRLLLCFAIAATGVTAVAVGRLFRRYRNLNRGEIGELKVAEALDELRQIGYRPIHSLKRDGFDIDHVVVGPAGVFAIETKFRSGSGEIEFRNGEGLFVGGHPEEKDCLNQARGNAREVNRLIQEHCGRFHWVKPLVVFVGDWRIKDRWLMTDARVFTPDRLRRYFDEQQPELTRNEIKLIASHLERSARS